MKRLISMTGSAGRARLEITEAGGRYEASYEGAGELWLLSGEGRPHRGKSAEFMPMGAMVLNENGELLLHGGLCGKKGAFERARAEAMLMRPQIAQHSAALGEILQKAAELFSRDEETEINSEKDANLIKDGIKAEECREASENVVNPFPDAFPFSRWKRTAYPGTDSCYLEGEVLRSGAAYGITALPGEYRPGRRPEGFERFLRGRDGSGYWVKIYKKPR